MFIGITETQTNAQVYLSANLLPLRSRNHRIAIGIRTGSRRAMSANPAVRAHPLTEPVQRRRHHPLRSAASAVLPLSNLDTATAAIRLLRYCFFLWYFSVLKVRNPVD
ncbi:hypothetical protein SASC598J21_006130, partial [Snodgrassella alvi SCGC AB-598-J21]